MKCSKNQQPSVLVYVKSGSFIQTATNYIHLFSMMKNVFCV